MKEKFNLSCSIIVNDQLDVFDIFKRSQKTNKNLKLTAPTRSLNSTSGGINFGTLFFAIEGAVESYNLEISNIMYSNNTVRGIFTVNMLNINDGTIGSKIFKDLNNFVLNLGYDKIFAYELNVRLTIHSNGYLEYPIEKKLKTMKSTKLRSIKLIDGNNYDMDLREQYISEIGVEELVTNPKMSSVIAVYRREGYNENAVFDILNDIDTVLELIR